MCGFERGGVVLEGGVFAAGGMVVISCSGRGNPPWKQEGNCISLSGSRGEIMPHNRRRLNGGLCCISHQCLTISEVLKLLRVKFIHFLIKSYTS
jgi:hypothetical protein